MPPLHYYSVVQAATDVAILTEIISMLQNGKIGGKSFNKIAGVGHSYGSVQLNAITQVSSHCLHPGCSCI